MSDTEYVRLSVNLHPNTASFLKKTADKHGLSISQVLWHALAVEKMIEQGTSKGMTFVGRNCCGKATETIRPIGEIDWEATR